MIKARIYKPAKTAMSSGQGKTKFWMMEICRSPAQKYIEPLMHWTGSDDTLEQVNLSFPSLEEAIKFAQERGFQYSVEIPHSTKFVPKNYASNFQKPIN